MYVKFREVLILLLLFFIVAGIPIKSFSSVEFDRIIANVNGTPVTEREVLLRMEKSRELRQKKLKILKKQKNKNELKKLRASLKRIKKRGYIYEKSRVLDELINEELLNETAKRESILVSDRAVAENMIDLMKKYIAKKKLKKKFDGKILEKMSSGIAERIKNKNKRNESQKDELSKIIDGFITFAEKIYGVDINTYFEQSRIELQKRQVMSIVVGMTPPTKEDIVTWYKKNNKSFGFEVNFRIIKLKPKGNSVKAQRQINELAEKLLKRIKRGASFKKIAKAYSADSATSKRGGEFGWVDIYSLNMYDRIIANVLYRMIKMKKRGRVFNQIIVSEDGDYCIIKLIGRRPVSFRRVQGYISHMLFEKKLQEQYSKWIQERRQRSTIVIYMEKYQSR